MIFFVACRAARGVIGIPIYGESKSGYSCARDNPGIFVYMYNVCVGGCVCVYTRASNNARCKGYRDYAICRMGIYGVFYFLLSSRGAALPVMTMRINGL